MNYSRWFISDYLADTYTLTWDQDLAYRRMLDHYYRTEKPLPKDRQKLYAAVRATTIKQKAAVEFVVKKYWRGTGGRLSGLVQSKASKELAKYQQNRANSSKGGKHSQLRRKSTSSAVQGQFKLPILEPTPKPETSNLTSSQEEEIGQVVGRVSPNVVSRQDHAKKPSVKLAVNELTLDKIDQGTITLALDLGLDPAEEFAAFKDYHREHGNRRSDWIAGFRNWCRRSKKMKEKGNGKFESIEERRLRQNQEASNRVKRRLDEASRQVGLNLPERHDD